MSEKKEETPFDAVKKALPKEEQIKLILPAPPPYPPVPSAILDRIFGIKIKKESK